MAASRHAKRVDPTRTARDLRERIVTVAARHGGHVLLELDRSWMYRSGGLADAVLTIIEEAMTIAYESGGRGTTVSIRLTSTDLIIEDQRSGTTMAVRLP